MEVVMANFQIRAVLNIAALTKILETLEYFNSCIMPPG